MKKSRLLGAICGVAFTFTAFSSHAIILTPGDSLTFNYDFSSDPASGPFDAAFFIIFIGGADAWETNTSVDFNVFDSSNTHIGSKNQNQPFADLLNTNISSGVSIPIPTSDKIGHVILSSVDSTFDFSALQWRLGQEMSFVELQIVTVPIPPALWLFGSGLLGLVGMARRKKT